MNGNVLAYLWVPWDEAVHVVVDLLEHKASVHEGEAALRGKTHSG